MLKCRALFSSANWGENKSNEHRGNIEHISSNQIRHVIHRTCRSWLLANEMDTCCSTFKCDQQIPGDVYYSGHVEVFYLENFYFIYMYVNCLCMYVNFHLLLAFHVNVVFVYSHVSHLIGKMAAWNMRKIQTYSLVKISNHVIFSNASNKSLKCLW